MSIRNLLWFYRRRVRARLVQELLALAGIAVGVALLFAVQVSNRSLSASIAQLTHGLVGRAQLQLVARSPGGFDERLVERARRAPGVQGVAPMLVVQANIVSAGQSRSLYMLAADQRLARLGGSLLSGYRTGSLERLHAIVLPLPLAQELNVRFGDTVRLQISGRSVAAPVGSVVSRRDVGPMADSPVAFAPLGYAQQLSGLEGRISRLYVIPERGKVALARRSLERIAAGRLTVGGVGYDRRLFSQAALPNDQSTALFASLSALVGFLLAFNAMLLMARERRGVIAELRMSGYRMWGVVEVLVFDAIVLGVAASICGVALGDQLSRHVFKPSPGYLAIAFPVGDARTVPFDVVVMACVTGVLAATLATLIPLVAAFRAPAMDAIDDAAIEPAAERGRLRPATSLAVGIAGLLTAVIVLATAPEAAVVGVAALIASALALLPTALAGVLSVLDRARRQIASVVPPVAIGELRSARSRSAAVAAIAAIAVFGSTAVESAHQDLQRALDRASHELSSVTDLWVSAAGAANTLATVPFPPTQLPAIARTPHVTAVRLYRAGLLDVGDRRVWVMAPPRNAHGAVPPNEIVEGDARTADARVARGGWATLSEALARARHLGVGDAFTLAAARPIRLRVAAVTTNFGWSPGAMVVNDEDFRRAWASDDVTALQVDVNGVSALTAKRLVARALGPAPGLTVETSAAREERHRATTRAGLARLTQIATLMLTAAILAITAAMAGMIWERRRRMAHLKLAGVTNRQLWLALMLESGLLLGVGSFLGALYGIVGGQLLDRGLGAVTGFPVDPSINLGVIVGSLALVTVVASAIVLLPGYMASRVPVEVAFQD